MKAADMKPILMSLAIGLVVVGAAGCGKESGTGTATSETSSTGVTKDAAKVVAVTVDQKGFSPSKIDVNRGEKLSLRFTRTTTETCADKVVFPELGIQKDLPVNQVVAIDLPTEQARSLTFQCGMGMYKSAVVVH